MTSRRIVPLRIAAVTATSAVLCMMTTFPSAADDGEVQVVNTETVQVYTDATGAIDTQRIYEQLALTGTGSVDLRNPVETDGLRNLQGFGGYDVEEGEQVTSVDVDGKHSLRSVSNYTGDLPLAVSVKYLLDGELVEPGDVVGESGKLEVRYTVKNVTGTEQEVTFDDGHGGTVTKTVEVPIPMIGSLTTVAPPSFTDVRSNEANLAGDGKGGTKLSFTMTLFPPIGSDTAEFGYTATITDGIVPRASISALPVNPLESPSFKTAGESYKGGADTGVQLTDGAGQIDANLLKLRDGAGELLAGLIQLRDGAAQLEAGLAGEAAPGAARLATGAEELANGVRQIDDGAGQLADGTDKLADGTLELNEGASQLNAGAGKLRKGAGRLAGGTVEARVGSRKLSGGLERLSIGATDLSNGFNSPTGKPDLVTGVASLRDGLGLIQSGVGTLAAGLPQAHAALIGLADGVGRLQRAMDNPGCDPGVTDPRSPERCGLLQGVQGLQAGLDEIDVEGLLRFLAQAKGAVQNADNNVKTALGTLAGTALARGTITSTAGEVETLIGCAGDSTLPGCSELAEIGSAVASLDGDITSAQGALGTAVGSSGTGAALAILTGVETEVSQLPAQLDEATAVLTSMANGIGMVKLGLSNQACDIADPKDPTNPCGMVQVLDELTLKLGEATAGVTGTGLPADKKSLTQGVDEAFAGAEVLATKVAEAGVGAGLIAHGLGDASTGGQDLLVGLRTLAAGAHGLSAGTGELKTGTGKLAGGTEDLNVGAGQLDAGAGQLADGTGKAADGANQLSDGADQLSTGLGAAAGGSGRLAEGLHKAADGAPALEDGAQRLSDEGSSKLIDAGQATAQNYGEMYAILKAGAKRAQEEDMVYGAPEGAMGLAAYSYEIKGEDGESGRNLARGLGGAALLAAGAGVFALRRRIV